MKWAPLSIDFIFILKNTIGFGNEKHWTVDLFKIFLLSHRWLSAFLRLTDELARCKKMGNQGNRNLNLSERPISEEFQCHQ